MYTAFTEEQAMQIRKLGLSVIEYKYCMRNKIDVWLYKLKRLLMSLKRHWIPRLKQSMILWMI